MNASRSVFIDASRWVAAFLVVISHIRSVVLVNFNELQHPGFLVRILYFCCGFGHVAVVIFFVLSGYLVGGRMLLRAKTQSVSLFDYASHRFARIYCVLIPALLLGLLLDRAGSVIARESGLYTSGPGLHIASLDFDVTSRLGLSVLAGNIAMLQDIIVPPFGSNGPLWSLSNEWWYYVAFGLLLAAYVAPRRVQRICAILIAAALLLVLPLGMSLGFIVWGVGALLINIERRLPSLRPLAALILMAGVMSANRTLAYVQNGTANDGVLSTFVIDLLTALAFGLALVSSSKLRTIGSARLHKMMASFSYTTYLIHFPAMLFCIAVSWRVFGFGMRQQPSIKSLSFAVGLTTFIYFLSWAFSLVTEAHTERLRRTLIGFVAPRGSAIEASQKKAA